MEKSGSAHPSGSAIVSMDDVTFEKQVDKIRLVPGSPEVLEGQLDIMFGMSCMTIWLCWALPFGIAAWRMAVNGYKTLEEGDLERTKYNIRVSLALSATGISVVILLVVFIIVFVID